MEDSSFNKRVADVFGALDKCALPKINTTRSDEDSHKNGSKDKEALEQPHPSRKHNSDGTEEQSKDSPGTRDDGESHRKHSHSSHDYPRSSKRPRYDHRRKHTSHAPGHRKNPQKWTKYDLRNDGTSALRGLSSEQINKHAALEFLSELRKNQSDCSESQTATDQSKDSEQVSSDSPFKITFKKPRKTMETSKSTSSQKFKTDEVVSKHVPVIDDVTSGSHDHRELSHDCIHDYHQGGGAGVVKMPEYEVGSKQTVPRKRKVLATSEAKKTESDGKRKVVSLGHLQDEDEDL